MQAITLNYTTYHCNSVSHPTYVVLIKQQEFFHCASCSKLKVSGYSTCVEYGIH